MEDTMSAYEPVIKVTKTGTKEIMSIRMDDGSHDEPSELLIYTEDLDKLVRALQQHQN